VPRLRVLVCLLLLAVIPAQAAQIADPWPSLASLPATRQEAVSFPSSDPFAPSDIGHAPARITHATLYLPAGAAPGHPVPAVVMLHGAAGMVAERGATYGPQLAAMGVATLVVDTYGSRTDLATGFIERTLNITETMFVTDAYAGLRYLAGRPEIDAHHVVLAGFSYGGMATMYALYAEMADRLVPPDLRFVGHVAFYGPCIARYDDSRTTGAPLLMLYGGKDELIRPDRCAAVAADLRRGGSEVTVISYPDAVHQWDGGMTRRMIGRNLSACSFRVDRQGLIHDATTGITMQGVFMRELLLFACVSSEPYPIGRDDAVRAQSNRDFGRFLTRVFAGPPLQPRP
jgi:dienelactone hydrolase